MLCVIKPLVCLLLLISCFDNIEALFRARLTMASLETKPREYKNLRPLPCVGIYDNDQDTKMSAVYLGSEKMTVQERADGKCIARDLVPIRIRDEFESAINSAMKAESGDRQNLYKSWSGQLITDRDGGFYDSLKSTFKWAQNPYARKEIYESLRLKSSCESPYHGIVNSLQKYARLTVKGLLIELADAPTANSMSLGAAILLCKTPYAEKWKLTCTNTKAIKAVQGSDEAQLVKCSMDELVGIAFATQLPIVISTTLFESATVDGLLEKNLETSKVSITAPYFSSTDEANYWRDEQLRQYEEINQRVKFASNNIPTINQIKDATTFLKLSNSEKRAILRGTGINNLPRPREGLRAVDAILIPMLDEEVAYEVLRRLAETRGDFAAAAEMNDFESRKPQLARLINEAKRKGDYGRAKELCDELNSLSTLRFDPTNPNSKNNEFDVEEWYWEQRKRVYGITA